MVAYGHRHPRPGARVTPEDVIDYCRERLAGKVLKRALREPCWPRA
ncbi:MAG TPA: hypothetical protein VHF26_03945 [Trebonia sp.]|nr:hypothetical protein [Trebonia sp.]